MGSYEESVMVPGVSSTMTSTPVARFKGADVATLLADDLSLDLVVGQRHRGRQDIGHDGIPEAVHGSGEYLFRAPLQAVIAAYFELPHAALEVGLVLFFYRFDEITLCFFGREIGDFLQFFLLRADKLVGLLFRRLHVRLFLRERFGFRLKVRLPLVEKLFFTHKALLRLLQVLLPPLEFR